MSEEPQYIDEIHDDPDAWHEHGAGETAPQHEHAATVNPYFISGVLVFIILFVAVLVVLVQMFFASTESRIRAAKTETVDPYLAYESDTAAQRSILASYGIADADAGTAHIPIEQAMQKIVERYNQ